MRDVAVTVNAYESERLLNEYLLFHYGAPDDVAPYAFAPDALGFPKRCASQCVEGLQPKRPLRALDVGCSVGGASFELARVCEEVVGIDYSRRFIDAARLLQRTGEMPFMRMDEGEISTSRIAAVPPDIQRERVYFGTGDAMNLPEDLGSFDIVLAANLICRLKEPARFLSAAPRLVKPGGRLVLTSPYSWLREFTPRERWLGGFDTDGKSVTTSEALHTLLEPAFALERRCDLPFLIREHRRKFQWSVAEATVWTRREPASYQALNNGSAASSARR